MLDFLSQCEEQSEVTRLFKTDIINALTNHLQCAICNEVVVEVYIIYLLLFFVFRPAYLHIHIHAHIRVHTFVYE